MSATKPSILMLEAILEKISLTELFDDLHTICTKRANEARHRGDMKTHGFWEWQAGFCEAASKCSSDTYRDHNPDFSPKTHTG